MAENKIKATSTLAKLYESQGLIADAIATYEAIYSETPSEELFQKIETLKHEFISSGKRKKRDDSPLAFIFNEHEKELFRILTPTQYKRYNEAYNPDTSDFDIKIEIEDDEERVVEIIDIEEDEPVKEQKPEVEKPNEVFQEVLDTIEEEEEIKEKIASSPRDSHPSAEDILKQNLVVRDLITHLKRIYGEDTLLKSIDRNELLESISSLF